MNKTQLVVRKKKLKWKPLIAVFVLIMIAGYYVGGIFTFKDLSIMNVDEMLIYVFTHPFENYWNSKTGAALMIAALLNLIIFAYASGSMKNYMPGREMGSAEWGNAESFNKKMSASDPQENIILSKNLRKAYDPGITDLNNNMCVIGGSGAGKTAGFIAPNILQFHGSNVYTDPKGDTLRDFGPALAEEGVRVVVLNLNEMDKSHHYNPFKYIRNTADLNRLITNLIANTTPPDAPKGEPFWENAESLFLNAIFSYVWYECDNTIYHRYIHVKSQAAELARQMAERELAGCTGIEEVLPGIWRGIVTGEDGKSIRLKKNFRSVLLLLDEAKVSDEEGVMSPLDCRMETLKQELVQCGNDPVKHPALRNYYRVIRGAGETIRSIIITANSRFARFDHEAVLDILEDDDIDIPSLGIGVNGDQQTKTALFCVLPDDDSTWNFIPGMLYTQMFQELYRVARKYDNKLPIDVGFWFDEFANIKMPNDFEKILATCRSRRIYITIILQSLAQLKALYKDAHEGIIGNCDSLIYLGGNEPSSHEFISKQLGSWTIDKKTTGETLGTHGSSSRNYDILGRELMTQDEIRMMPKQDCIILIRGEHPFYDQKLYWFKEQNWQYVNELKKYEFQPFYKPLVEFIDDGVIEGLKKSGKEVIEYSFYSLEDFIAVDFDNIEKNIAGQISTQVNDDEDRAAHGYDISFDDADMETFMIHYDLAPDQISAISDAISRGVPDNILEEIIKNQAEPERIRLIADMYCSGFLEDQR